MTAAHATDSRGPLSAFNAVSLAQNLPGPVALAKLVADGISARKVEPPAGDILRHASAAWYKALHQGVDVEALDLRSDVGQAALRAMLEDADLLITSQRPSALARLGITAAALTEINSRLCWVEIVGDVDAPEVPGHDLTYQMEAGLVAPPSMPLTLVADLGGAGDAARAALTLLLGRETGSAERHRTVGLKQAAEGFAAPARHALTSKGGPLSGAFPGYRIFELKDGWAAVAAIEPHFAVRFAQATGDDPVGFFADQSAAEVNALARANDLPISCVSRL